MTPGNIYVRDDVVVAVTFPKWSASINLLLMCPSANVDSITPLGIAVVNETAYKSFPAYGESLSATFYEGYCAICAPSDGTD